MSGSDRNRFHWRGARPGASLLLAVAALAAGLFGAGEAAAQNRCTLTSADIPSLSVTAGSSNAVILDTADPTTAATMNTLCAGGGMTNFGFEAASPSQDIANNNVITLPSGSTIKRTTAGTTRTLTYSAGAGVIGSETVSPFVAAAGFRDAAQTQSVAGRTVRFYPNGSAVGVYFTVVVEVTAPDAPTAAVTSLSPNPIFTGQSSMVAITLTNPNGSALAGVADTISLPGNVLVAATPAASTSCGGTLTATAGAGTVTLAGGALGANGTCTLSFDVTSSVAAAYTIPSGTPSATGANAGSAGGTATLTVNAAPAAPTIIAAWDQANVALGGNRTLTVTISNPNGTQLNGIGFNAGTLDAALSGSSPGTTCSGSTATYVGGSRQFSLSGGTLNAGASCTATLTVSTSTPGTYSFTTGTVFATGPVPLTGATATTGSLTAWSPPTISVTAASPITVGAASTVQLSFANANAGSLTGVGTIVSLPANVVIATPANVVDNCGGTVTAVAGSGTATVSGGTVTGGGSCTVAFDVTSSVAGSYSIPTGTPTSSQGGSGVAGTPASLVVNGAAPVISSFTAAAVAYGSTGNGIDVATGTAPSGAPTSWNISKSAGGSFGATAESANSGVVNVSINTGTGQVTYAAPTGYRGNDIFYVRATNATGDSNVAVVTVPVGNPSLAISLTGSGVRGTALAGVAVLTTGGHAPYSCGAPSVPMPAGVTLNSDCTITGTPSASGSTSFRVDVTDSSTGTGPFTQQSPVLVLDIVPPAPTITALAPDTGSTAGGTSVQINGTNFDPGQVTAVTWDGGPIAHIVDAGGGFITVTSPAHAAGAINVSVTTTGGTSANAVFTYIAPPAAPVVTAPANGATIGTAAPTYQGTAGNNLVITVYVDGASIGTTTSSAGGAWSLAQPSPLSDGAHNVRATATDNGVTSGFSGTNSFTVDSATPAAPVLIAPANGSTTGDNTPTITGTAEANATVTVSLDGAPAGTTTAAAGGAWSFTPGAPLGDGPHTASATATDQAGHTSPPSNTNSFTVDTAAPAAPVVVAPANGSTTDATPTFSGTAEPNATVTVIVDGASVGTTPADASGNWSRVSAALAIGAHTIRATATDAAGNVSPSSNTNGFTVAAIPSVTGLSPDQGPTAGGTSVTITGANLTGATAVHFGANPATGVTVNNATSITAVAPAGAAGTVNVTVTTPAGTSATGPASQYAYVAGPTIATVSPSTGPLAGGNAVILTGTGFTGTSAVHFGATPATAFTVNSATQITATAPAGSAGPVTVSVTTPGGSATGTYTYVAAPVAGDRNGVAVAYGTATPIDLSGAITGPHTSIAIGTAPAHGTVSIAGDIVTYTPAAGYFGPDSFTYTATGPGGTSAPGTVNLVVSTPAAPVAADKAGVAVPFNSAGTAIDLSASITGVHSAIAVATAPAHGTTSIAGDVVTYTPAAGYSGPDSFTYTATGPGGTSAPATVSLTVGPPPAPVAADKTGVAVAYNSSGTAIDLSGSITGIHTGIAVATAPAHGTTSVAGDIVTYTPTSGYSGPDSFTYTATGPGGTSPPATVSLTVAAPTITLTLAALPDATQDSAYSVQLTVSGGTAPYSYSRSAGTLPAGIALSATGLIAGTPTENGSFTFTATVRDSSSGAGPFSANRNYTLVVLPPPPPAVVDAPSTTMPSATINQSQSTDINLSNLTTGNYTEIRIDTPPQHGTATLRQVAGAGGAPAQWIATYRPTIDFVGVDRFTFVAIGPGGTSAPANVTINVVGAVPEAPSLTASTLAGQEVTVDLTATARQGPFTGAAIVSIAPANSATATLVEGGTPAARTYQMRVRPDGRFSGATVVTYTLANQFGSSAPATVTVTVTARPDPSQDPSVRGLVAAQADATKRFASAQLDNFNRRNEQLHDGGGASRGSPIGINLGSSDRQVLQRPGERTMIPDAVAMKMGHAMATLGAERASGLLDSGETNIGGPRRGATDGAILGGLRARNGAMSQGRSEEGGSRAADGDANGSGGERARGSLAIWSGGAIQIGTRDATSGRARLSMTSSGLSAGADLKLGDGAIFGLGGGYGGQRTSIGEDEQARLTGHSWIGAVYGSVRPFDGTFIDGVAGIGGLDFSTRRIAPNNQLATGSRDGTMRFGSLSLGMDRNGQKSVFSAYARGEYVAATLRAYTEGGAGLYNLRFGERDLTSFSSVLGFRGSIRIATEAGILKPRARFEWRHEFESGGAQFLDYADLAGLSYRITDTGWLRDSLSPELGIGLETEGWIFGADLAGQFGEGSRSATLRLSVGKEF